jgi:hypothetical protein
VEEKDNRGKREKRKCMEGINARKGKIGENRIGRK